VLPNETMNPTVTALAERWVPHNRARAATAGYDGFNRSVQIIWRTS